MMLTRVLTFCFIFLAALSSQAQACFVCMGDPNSPMSAGLRMGIITLLVFLIFVLGAFAKFFWRMTRRATATVPYSVSVLSGTRKDIIALLVSVLVISAITAGFFWIQAHYFGIINQEHHPC